MYSSKDVKPFGFKDKLGYLLGDLGKRFLIYIFKFIPNAILH